MAIRRMVAIGVLALAAARVAPAQARVSGTVFDSLRTHAGLVGATVVINELPAFATTDSKGRFEFDAPIPAGAYTITFHHSMLDSLLVGAEVLPLTVPPSGRVPAQLSTPSPQALLHSVCPGVRDSTTGLLLGRVHDAADGHAVPGAEVRVEWTEYSLEANGLAAHTRQASARTNADGAFAFCNLPSDLPVDLSATSDSNVAGPVHLMIDSTARTERRDFSVAGRGATGTVAGAIRSPSGGAAAGAIVEVAGTSLVAKTDEQGQFTIRDVPAGTRSIEVRQIGAQATTSAVDVPTHGAVRLDVALQKNPVQLSRVSIIGKARALDKTGFSERERSGVGVYMDEDYIARHGQWDIQALLTTGAGTRSAWSAQYGREIAVRGGCIPTYWVDGNRWIGVTTDRKGSTGDIAALSEISAFLHTTDIRAIEIYRSREELPAEFTRLDNCGAIAIWTK